MTCAAPGCAIVPRQFRVLFKRTFFLTTWSTFQAVISPVLAALCVAILMSMDNDLLEGAKPTVDSVQHTTAAIASLLSALASVPSLYTKVRRHSATCNWREAGSCAERRCMCPWHPTRLARWQG